MMLRTCYRHNTNTNWEYGTHDHLALTSDDSDCKNTHIKQGRLAYPCCTAELLDKLRGNKPDSKTSGTRFAALVAH